MTSIRTLYTRWVIWGVIALVGFAGAVAVTPDRLVSRLPAEAESLKGQLLQGVNLVRVGLASAALLAVFCAAFWKLGKPSTSTVMVQPLAPSPRRADFLVSLIVFGISVALMAPRLGMSLWWDELSSLVRVVGRGIPVILSWSCIANNHILNSLLMKLSIRLFGEGEVQVRLPAFLLGLMIPQVVFWFLRAGFGRRLATTAALFTTLHFWITRHGIEARGYSGAILFSTLASFLFASLLKRPSIRLVLAYIVCGVASTGFITTCIFVPFAHGLVAAILYLRQCIVGRRDGPDRLDAVLACLWVGVGYLVAFGLPLPQTIDYARNQATRDHLPLGLPLIGQIAEYLTSVQPTPAALLTGVLALVGWWAYRRDLGLCLVFLAPGFVTAIELSVPGTTASPRFLCYMLVPTALGIAGFVMLLAESKRPFAKALLMVLVLGWALSVGSLHRNLILRGTPDLKGLAARTQGKKVLLIGPQADMNVYYFKGAETIKEGEVTDQDVRSQKLAEAEVIVQGYLQPAELEPEPAPEFFELGFAYVESLRNFGGDGTSYLVYRRQKLPIDSRNP